MADVITRFKLETTQYDSKLRDAAKGLQEFTKQAELGGKGFTNFSQKSIEAARALGTIASGATTTKDKVKDLVGAYNDAARAYNKLSQEQQQSDFGKALAQSITQLSGRLKEAKQELYGLGNAVEEVKTKSGGLFGEGGLTGMLAVTGGNLLASGLTKLGSELADTVQQSIELAKSGEGVRIAFERLNRPDLLANLKEATHGTVSELELMKAAIKFENFKLPLEDLATYLAFAQQKAQDTGDSVDNMVTSIVNGLGRQSVQILDNLGISASEIRNRMKEGGDMTQVVAQIIREEMAKAGDYVETAATRAARAAAEATDKMEALGRQALPVAEEWAKAWNEIKIGGMEVINFALTPLVESIRSIRELLNKPFEIKFKADVPNLAEGSNIDENGNFIKRPSNGNWAGYDAAKGRYYNEISSIPEISVTGTKPKKTAKRGGGGKTDPTYAADSIAAQTALVSELSKKWNEAGENMRDSYLYELIEAENKLKDMKDSQSKLREQQQARNTAKAIKIDSAQGLADSLGLTPTLEAIQADLNAHPLEVHIETTAKDVKAITQAAQTTAKVVGTIGDAFNSIEDPASKVAGTVAQAIASIALGYATATTEASSMGPWAWVAFAATGLAEMLSIVSAIHSATGYAEGGEIKGNSYSGDRIPIMANAGEIVLNKAQQSTLAQNLQNNGGGNFRLVGKLAGEDIIISAERAGKRMGYGQLMFWNGN